MTNEEHTRIRVLLAKWGFATEPTFALVADRIAAIAAEMRPAREELDAMRGILAANGADRSAAGQWLSALTRQARELASLSEAIGVWRDMSAEKYRDLFGGREDPKQRGGMN